ncbi:hypothetical protein QQF64_003008 [Cirrhinus molitorella]|uniref:Uncharacterized protein n=1 Tax=Cirrhinus molitorella TaxID=172907 RepID=A0ABR3MIU1_9TELE
MLVHLNSPSSSGFTGSTASRSIQFARAPIKMMDRLPEVSPIGFPWLKSSAGHAPTLRLVVLHVAKCRQAVLKAVPDRDYRSDSTLAEHARGSERGRGESERETEGKRERERDFSPRAGSTFARWHQIQGCCPS